MVRIFKGESILHELQGVEPIVSVARVYNDNSSAHVLGYVSQASSKDLSNKKYLRHVCSWYGSWQTGLEETVEDIIGKEFPNEVNAFGKELINSSRSGQAGKNFKTTLDLEVQKYAAEAYR